MARRIRHLVATLLATLFALLCGAPVADAEAIPDALAVGPYTYDSAAAPSTLAYTDVERGPPLHL